MHVDLIVPAYNEVGNLRRLVDRTMAALRSEADDWTFGILLVVSDRSSDGTVELASELEREVPEVSMLLKTSNFGFGNALKDGLDHADGDVLIPFMADLSDDPHDVPKMVEKIREGYDVVYGSRFVDGGSAEGYPPLKLFYNRAFNNLIRLMFGIGERDVTNAFTAYRREVIETVDMSSLRSESFDITAELPLRAAIEGFETTEVPVSWRSRDSGVSDLNATRMGPVYLSRVFEQFFSGMVTGVRDIVRAVAGESPLRLIGTTLVGVLLLVALLSLTDSSGVSDAILGADPTFVGAILLIYPVSFLLRAWRWRILLRPSGHLPSRANTFRAIMTGWFVNSLVPARAGDLVRGYALKATDDVPFGVGIGTIVVERIFDLLFLGVVMALIATLYLRSAQSMYLAAGVAVVGAVLVVAVLVLYRFGSSIARLFEGRMDAVSRAVRSTGETLRRMRMNVFSLLLATAISVGIWMVEVSTIYLAGRAIGIRLGFLPTVATGVSAFASQIVPLTPAGIGTYEATVTSVLYLFGVRPETGTAIAFTDHFARLGVIYVLGSLAMVHLVFQFRVYVRRIRERSRSNAMATDSEQS